MADGSASFKDAGGATQQHDAKTNAAGTELRPTVTLGNDGDLVVGVEPFGALTVNAGPATIFYDSWPGTTLDVVDKWTVTGTTPTISAGNMTMPATVSTFNAIRTKDVIRANAGFAYVANGISIETTTATGAGRFWGLGVPATTPTPGVLVQDGVGFELDQATGTLLAVTYSSGARTTVATLTRPADGLPHRYGMYFRVTGATWFVDNPQIPLASVSFPTMAVVELPALYVRQNAASFTGTPVFVSTAHLTADTARQGMTLIDPVVGARQARVTAAGALQTASTDWPGATPGGSVVTTSATVNTNAQLLAADPLRRGLILANNSTGTVTVAFGVATTATLGVKIGAGTVWEVPSRFVAFAINAQATVASAPVYCATSD